MSDAIWLDKRDAARILTLDSVAFTKRVKAGKLPSPSFHLGERTPRWNLAEIHEAMAGNHAKARQEPLSGAINAILNTGRQKAVGGRNDQKVSLRAARR